MDSMIEELEKYLVIDTLKRLDNNVTKTANTLKISRPRLYRSWKKFHRKNWKNRVYHFVTDVIKRYTRNMKVFRKKCNMLLHLLKK